MRVFVLGGTGFIGTHLVEKLLADGHEVVALARDETAFRRFGKRIAIVKGDITKPATFRGQMLHCDASLNLVGIIRERRSKGVTYERVVAQGTRNWVRECEESSVKRAVYISALGADPKGTGYQRSKWAAEQTVRNTDLEWTIFRPSFVLGEEGAVAEFAGLLKLRIVPVWGRQDYYFDPVDVDDLVTAISRSLTSPKARRRVYAVGGPDRVTYKEMLRTISKVTGRRAMFVPAPWLLAYTMGALLGWLPFFPATLENMKMLRQGSAAPDQVWAREFDIEPRSFEGSLRRHLTQAR